MSSVTTNALVAAVPSCTLSLLLAGLHRLNYFYSNTYQCIGKYLNKADQCIGKYLNKAYQCIGKYLNKAVLRCTLFSIRATA